MSAHVSFPTPGLVSRPILAVSAFVFNSKEQLLIVQRGQPPGQLLWSVPGGKVRAGEPLHTAVNREVFEETGVIVVCGKLLFPVEYIQPEQHYVILTYSAQLQDASNLRASSDAKQAEFLSLDELRFCPVTPGLIEFAQNALSLFREQV